jgi:DNA-directed RNA polymerase specialized sigma54-like protein
MIHYKRHILLRREGNATLTLLDLMALHKMRKVDEEDILDMPGETRRLGPKPGAQSENQ